MSAEVERLRTQHADAVREKSASDSKCRKLTDRVAALEREKADLRRQLAAERREANEAIAKEQAAQAEAKLARAEGNIAKELAGQRSGGGLEGGPSVAVVGQARCRLRHRYYCRRLSWG